MRVILVFLLGTALFASAEGAGFDEYQVKAAFLYNFAKFVEWPANTFANAGEPVTICVVGRNPFGPILESMLQGKMVTGRALAVRMLPDPRQPGKCQILFIAASERKRASLVLEQIGKASILTVGEADEFTAVGGMVNLKLDGARVRIQIALDAVEHAKLLISSKLLSLAEIVRK